ncbi:MAG: cell division protein ZapA [Spirochaetota bacterium]
MRIELLGTSFTVHTDEDPERLRDIVDYYKTKVQEIQGSVSTDDELKVAILAGLLSVDELFKARGEVEPASSANTADTEEKKESSASDGEVEEVEEIANNLIETLDATLDE